MTTYTKTMGKQTEAQMGAGHPTHKKPRWVTGSPHRQVICETAKIRSAWFALYSFGGGTFTNPITGNKIENCTREKCAKEVVRYSKVMLSHMKKIGRTPIAGDNKGLREAWTPKCDREWEARMKQQYSLYLSVDELYDTTDRIIDSREVNDEDIQIMELSQI